LALNVHDEGYSRNLISMFLFMYFCNTLFKYVFISKKIPKLIEDRVTVYD